MLIFENKNVMDLGADGGSCGCFWHRDERGKPWQGKLLCWCKYYRMRWILAGEVGEGHKMGRLGRESQKYSITEPELHGGP